ncbi:MAG: glycosyltransferase family 4 protein [bacterium]
MQAYVYSYLLLTCFLFSILLVPVAKKIALRFGVLDKPNERKVHEAAKPLLGGLGIFGAMLVAIILNVSGFYLVRQYSFVANNFGQIIAQSAYLSAAVPKLAAILGGATVMVVVGILDDTKGKKFRYQYKFLAQFVAAGAVALAGVHTSFLPYGWMNQLLSIFWIVGITNAFNLLDNMDGLSAGAAAIAAGIFFYISASQLQFFNAALLITMVGALLGFLRYNFSPAKIFMGDTGSLFLGFMFGSITLTMSYTAVEASSRMPVTVVVPLWF